MNNYAWTATTTSSASQERAAQHLRDWELTTHKPGAAARLAQLRTMCAVALAALRGGPRSPARRRARTAIAR
jgi:hypothetical protein